MFHIRFLHMSFINSWPWGYSNITNGVIFGRNIVLVYFFKKLFTDDLKDADSILTKVHCVKKKKLRDQEKLRVFLYSVRIRENTDQKKLRIWTLSIQNLAKVLILDMASSKYMF